MQWIEGVTQHSSNDIEHASRNCVDESRIKDWLRTQADTRAAGVKWSHDHKTCELAA